MIEIASIVGQCVTFLLLLVDNLIGCELRCVVRKFRELDLCVSDSPTLKIIIDSINYNK